MVVVDTHVAFRRTFELNACRSGGDLVHIKAAGFFNGVFPEPRTEVTSLRHIADYRFRTIFLFKRSNKFLVVFVVE